MLDRESIKKMLRSVLQSSKAGVSITNLQSEYRSLCGENIPLKKLGYSKLEDYLRSIPSVVRLESCMGELKCFAAVCKETAHIAELVARQKSSKKTGHSQFVNCKMRFKPSDPYMLNVKPRSSLRQPSTGGISNWIANRSWPRGGLRACSAPGDYRLLDQSLSSITPVEHRQPAPQPAVKQCIMSDGGKRNVSNCQKPRDKPLQQVSKSNQSKSCLYDMELVENRLIQLLQKFSSGLWLSKLSAVYRDMFSEQLHPQVLIDLEKWAHICVVETPFSKNRADRLIYPPLPSAVPKCSTTPPTSPTNSSTAPTQISLIPSTPKQPSTPLHSFPVQKHGNPPKPLLAEPRFIFPPQPVAASSSKLLSSVKFHSPARNPALSPWLPACVNLGLSANSGCKNSLNPKQNTQLLSPTCTHPASTNAPTLASPLKPGPDVLPLLKITFSPTSDSAPCPPSESSAVLSAEVRQRIKELLSLYSQGLWAHALPKLFVDTYKMPFPEHILDNLSVLLDICTVEYPIPHNKNKAILYYSSPDIETTESQESQECQQCRSHPLPSGLEVLGSVRPPCLVPPSEQYPSVLITDAKSSNAVTIRYVGENYSNAQEAMEDAMHSFYSPSSAHHPLANPVVGQLVAVRGEDGDELARAQVIEVIAPNKVKVYYVDYGFSVETSEANLLELHQDFLSLSFQATNVRLAGLEALSSHPLVLSSLDKLAVGKILLMETLEPSRQNEMPVAVLFDTSQDFDININSACLKTLQDQTMNNPLTVNAIYQDVCVTNVCADGIIYCQLPSRGTARLSKLLEETEAIFTFQVISESLVTRPFSGKFCLARHNGKWSRVEITNMCANRVMEILFIDLGVPATVEVTDLREFPAVYLKDFTIIPPQAIKCRLADLPVPDRDWSPKTVQWIKNTSHDSKDYKMKISKVDRHEEDCTVYMYLFTSADSLELDKSINRQLAKEELLHKLMAQNTNSTINSSVDSGTNPIVKAIKPFLHGAEDSPSPGTTAKLEMQQLSMPPPLELPQAGQNMDVFVPVACHPGYFVLQLWQDLHKLLVLMGEMTLYYNKTWKTNTATNIQKGEVYAAKIDKNWCRVQVKGILANGMVSVYELDHGKHELVRSTVFQPLIEEFRQLPFQAFTAQLAGVTQHQWSEQASMLFRNHVEGRALVAQVVSVQEVSEVKGERMLTVYLVDTTLADTDLWIHTIMANIGLELSSAA